MKASLTVRTNEEFDSCRVRKGRDDIVDISDRDRGQQVRLTLHWSGGVFAEDLLINNIGENLAY